MPILAEKHLPIPTQDILSWCWSNRRAYDQDAPLYTDCASGTALSANDVWSLVRRAIAGFRAIGVRRGDVVCIHSFNSLWYPILVLGTIGAGGVFVGTNPSYTKLELEHAIDKSGAKFIIAEPDVFAGIASVAAARHIPSEHILVFAEPEEVELVPTLAATHRSWRSILEHGSEDWERFDDLETSKNTTAALLFSSGTTGLPKPAQLSHYNLIAESTLVHENPDEATDWRFSMINCLPFFHASTAPYTFTTVLRTGNLSYIMRRFDLQQYLINMEKFKIQTVLFVPPMLNAIVALADSNPEARRSVRQALASVKWGVSGAAPLGQEMQARMQALLPESAHLTQLWASTETSCIATYFYWKTHDTTASVGKPIPNIDIKLVDDKGNEVKDGQEGELYVRGPTVTRGYLNSPSANDAWDAEGYYHTGDILKRDPSTKLLYVVDRKKELIKVRGFQVAPAEHEAVLLSHDDILDAAVIGIPDARSGEVPRAYIVKKQGKDLTEAEVVAWIDQRLARYKRLEGGVKFVDAIPKNASGKILKRLLREQAKAENVPSTLKAKF